MKRAFLSGLALAAAALTLSCDEAILVHWATKVYEDGSFQRRLEVTARDPNGGVPPGSEWIEEDIKLRLADPNAWSHVERTPGRLLAEGFFQNIAALPRAVAHATDTGLHPDRTQTTLRLQDLVVVRCWLYRETYGDPYGKEDAASALDSLMEMARSFLHEGIRSEFGEGVDPKPADDFLGAELYPVASELVSSGIISPGGSPPVAGTSPTWLDVLVRRRIPCGPVKDIGDPEPAFEALIEWSRVRLAEKLSTPRRIIHPGDLDFLSEDELGGMAQEDYTGKGTRIIERLWGSEEAFQALLQARIEALAGYYNSGGIPAFTFESRLELPGRLLTTNGTPDGDGILWLFRGEDLRGGDRVMEAASAVLDDEKLRALGARRELDAAALLRVTDVLSKRDAGGRLAALLRRGVARGGLILLRQEPEKEAGGDAETEVMKSLRRELADLLDPAVESP